ncbi:hypothetical protein HDU86_001961 [Geranomyces michiganensis]|nr:hypothetical protein HDU86_001961 [Geranomyces michiganensis]
MPRSISLSPSRESSSHSRRDKRTTVSVAVIIVEGASGVETGAVARRGTGLAALAAAMKKTIAKGAGSGRLATITGMTGDGAPVIAMIPFRAEARIGGAHARRGLKNHLAAADAGARKRKSDKKERKGDKSKHKKKDKKEKRDKKKKKKPAAAQYGAYGVIAASDMYRKDAEFRTWLVEVQNISPESLSNFKMKEIFMDYMEAYNTATLPVKYYDLDKWEREQSIRQQAEAGQDGNTPEFDILKDEEMLKQHSKTLRMGKLPELNYSQDQLNELKKVSIDRVAADRLRKMGYQPKDSMGVRYEQG